MFTRYFHLRAAVAVLADVANAQRSYLMSLPAFEAAGEMIPYQSAELASQFEDYFVSIYHMLEANELSSVQVKTLNDLDGVISAMKSKKGNDFWRLDALDVDPDWDEIRSSAKAALKTLPLQQQPF